MTINDLRGKPVPNDMQPYTNVNIVFLGGFDYPRGMAGTKRIQHAIDGLVELKTVSIKVLIIRQSKHMNNLCGFHKGILYQTITGDLSRTSKLLKAPIVNSRTKQILRKLFKNEHSNYLYIYGPPTFDILRSANFARRIGYKVLYDIVEDYDFADERDGNWWHRVANLIIRRSISNISSIADGIVVISSHLEKKLKQQSKNIVPLHNMPITVNLDIYPEPEGHFGDPPTIFYAGSFGNKDGVPLLIEAFEKLAAVHQSVCLVMTGKGAKDAMDRICGRIYTSRYKDRIFYRGYLNDDDYYTELFKADILCMPRIDSGYANAGFPFKLGEYLATGKPVVASAVSDVPVFLQDGHDAVLVEPGDSEAIFKAISELINKEEKAFEIGAYGRATARRLFDYRKQGERLMIFLNQIMDASCSRQ
jgi:glycosyltransferase involved in cell wall biosynthesis